jgi:hypothetical protein
MIGRDSNRFGIVNVSKSKPLRIKSNSIHCNWNSKESLMCDCSAVAKPIESEDPSFCVQKLNDSNVDREMACRHSELVD